MKKFALTLLCLGLLTGCGRVEPDIHSSEAPVINDTTESASTDEAEDPARTTSADKDKKEKSTNTTKAKTSFTTRSPEELAKLTSAAAKGKTNNNTKTGSVSSGGRIITNQGGTNKQPATAAPTQPPTPAPTQAPTERVITDKFVVGSDGVAFYVNGEKKQLLNVDTAAILNTTQPPQTYIIEEDFDFDLNKDVFVPTQIGTSNVPGKYFRYDPNTDSYVEWDQLNALNNLVQTNANDGVLTVHDKTNAVEYEDKYYSWEGGSLVLKGRDKQYTGADGQVYKDLYTIENGAEKLYMKQHILLGEDNSYLGAEDITPQENAPQDNTTQE